MKRYPLITGMLLVLSNSTQAAQLDRGTLAKVAGVLEWINDTGFIASI